ncbi:MAG: RHS repeat-associated core domain-containing protein [Acidobacteria bacterium]|nr:RHS repeat-associated core domain-containing protein [Acidobacteriota bacterium]
MSDNGRSAAGCFPADPDTAVASRMPQKFTGKERDAETGLDYFLARYYSGAQGRFLSPDEFKGGPDDALTGKDITSAGPLPYADISNPQSLNKYAYVYSNPLRYTDPDGHQGEEALVKKMIEALRAPISKGSGLVKGGLIQTAADYGVQKLLGSIFGYTPHAFKGGLSMKEYATLNKASSYEKGAHMLGVGQGNAKGIDADDIDNVKGISLKSAANPAAAGRNALEAYKSASTHGFHDVQVYIDAPSVSPSDVTGLTKIQNTLSDGTISKVVIFTSGDPVEYLPKQK